ncbi:MAG: type IV secretion system DNA-binding domain-containing protein [Gammaproteobacteria bacterium]|nr:type IV secretion system DNA-binding domain-containing protein [Gammaproteobacteria bacterium]
MNMQTHRQSLNKLRNLREQAPTTLKRGKKTKSYDNILSKMLDVELEKLQAFGGLSFATAALGFGYTLKNGAPLDDAFNLAIQISIFIFSLFFSLKFYLSLFSFSLKKSLSFLREKDFSIRSIICANIFYLGFYLFNALPPYFSRAWEFGLSSDQALSWLLPTWPFVVNQNFYIMWVIFAVCMSFLIEFTERFDGSFASSKTKKPSSTDRFKLWLGKSTGILSKLSHGAGMAANQNIVLNQEDASQNIIIMGGIGSGKTSRSIHPLLMQLVDQDCGGLIFDIKGNFHGAVNTVFEAVRCTEKLKVIGQRGGSFNLIEGLTPETAASFLKSSLMLSGTRSIDSFWLDTASDLCRNILGVLSFLKEHYNLSSLHEYLFDEKHREMINKEAELEEKRLQTLGDNQQRLIASYRKYYDNVFSKFDERVQTGVLASVEQILSTFSNPTISDMFCKHSDVSMNEVLEGTVYLVDLPLTDWGLGGKVIYNLIKLRFFNVMQQRESKQDWNQSRPVFFLCDEYQEIVSSNKDGLSDLNFWDKARSSKTIGVISTQSVSSFYAAIGNRDMANALLQNFRQKIIYRTEDQATLDLLNRLTGNVDVEKRSISRQSGASSSGSLDSSGSYHRSRSENITSVSRPVLDSQQIRTLDQAQAIAILVIAGNSYDDILNMTQIHF